MLRILLLIVPIINGVPNVRTGYDGKHCYQGNYTILLNGTFWCRGSPHTPSNLELWQYQGVNPGKSLDNNIRSSGSQNNELHYNRTYNYKETDISLSLFLHIQHSCDMLARYGCSHLYVLRIPDSNIYCNGSMNPFYNFTAHLNGQQSGSNGGCPGELEMFI
uniref:Pancreatic ribonuclease n=1 Tax=Parastrongyloides trichosuri TaxID=131310 RepID=A0A0N5A6D3_PARTI